MSVSKIGINEEGNQANHQRQHQGILRPVKIAPGPCPELMDTADNLYHRIGGAYGGEASSF